MPKKRTNSTTALPDRWFIKELKGETPPSFTTMENLYGLAFDLYGLRPWRLLNENHLILVRDTVSGETCYCSVMGALGEVYSVHVYIGTESFRLFRRMEAEEITDPGEFFASQRGVSVGFVPKTELEPPDRELLSAMKHPKGRGVASPIFRAIRPGFLPWFVTEEEAQTLTECLRAVIAVCSAVVNQKSVSFWDAIRVSGLFHPMFLTEGNLTCLLQAYTAAALSDSLFKAMQANRSFQDLAKDATPSLSS
jgi:hypothetical protein